MNLNPDIVRDTLLYLEEYLTLNDNLEQNNITIDYLARFTPLKKYSPAEIVYTVSKLSEAEFLTVEFSPCSEPRFGLISSITYKGHEFLNTIRNDEHFTKAKEICSKLGNFSLDILKSVIVSLMTK